MADQDRMEQLNAALEGLVPAADREMRQMLAIAGAVRHMPGEEFRARLKRELVEKAELKEKTMTATETSTPTLMPYLVAQGAAKLIDFMKQTFGARELERYTRPDGTIMHTAVVIGNSTIELADGNEQWPSRPAVLHVYVPDVDAVYERALAAGGTSPHPPVDQPYGDRESAVKDPLGNQWYISTHKEGTSHVPEGLGTVTPFLQVRGADRLIEFLKQAFSAEEAGVYRSTEGGPIVHAKIRIGGAMIELSELRAPYQRAPIGLHHYVRDTDEVYRRAVEAGGKPKDPPSDKPYGERNATVVDPAGNEWFIATKLPMRK